MDGQRGLRSALRAAGALALTFLAGCATDGSSMLKPHGIVAAAQRGWLMFILWCMAVIILPIFVMVPAFAWRYRRTRGNKAAYNPGWDFSWMLELWIWGVPCVIVVVLGILIWSYETPYDPYRRIASDQTPLEIDVVAMNWKWLFLYPDQHIATVGSMAVPVGRPVMFRLTSVATMQSFYIPALGSQIYAMAGMVTRLNLRADRSGHMLGENTQFNGVGFQDDKFDALALPPGDFDAWVGRMRTAARPLDAAALNKLTGDSTADQAKAAFGVDEASTLAFIPTNPGLFMTLVDHYHTHPMQMVGMPDATIRPEPDHAR